MGGFDNQSGGYLSGIRSQMLTDGSDTTQGAGQNNGGQWHAPYGGDVGTTFRPGGQTQAAPNDGQWHAPYGGDVPNNYRPGGQQPAQPNPPGYDGTVQAGGPQRGAPQTDTSNLLPGAGDVLPGPDAPVVQRNMFGNAIAGGTGAWLMGGPLPDFLSKNAARVLESDPPLQLGSKFFGTESWAAKNLGTTVAGRLQTGLDTAPATAANWWKSIEVPRAAAPVTAAAADATATVAADGAATAAKTFTFAGQTINLTKTGEFLAKPGVSDFLKGAGIAGGTVLADHITPGDDSYGFSTVGVPIALAMPGDFKTKALVAGGSLAAGKIFNWAVPASEHPELHNFLAPTLTENALMTGALFLPVNNEAKLYTIGGAYALGRMAKMNDLGAGGCAAGVGIGTYMLTHNATIAALAGAGSYVGSRVLKII
jgi:hypothetical protein